MDVATRKKPYLESTAVETYKEVRMHACKLLTHVYIIIGIEAFQSKFIMLMVLPAFINLDFTVQQMMC